MVRVGRIGGFFAFGRRGGGSRAGRDMAMYGFGGGIFNRHFEG